eukprot:7164049-Alexandrium_andersonii.AAC.1
MSTGTRAVCTASRPWSHRCRLLDRTRTGAPPDRSRKGAATRTQTKVAQVRHTDRGRTDAGSPAEVAQERSPTK